MRVFALALSLRSARRMSSRASSKDQQSEPEPKDGEPERRTFLVRASSIAMTGGLVAAYGAFGASAARYVYPAKPPATEWLFVAVVAEMASGAIVWRSPIGTSIVVARSGKSNDVSDFVALSSTCPHLGCQVFWEPQNDRFFCPCHNGTFDRGGTALSGPPAEAKQSLPRYPLEIRNGLLFIQVPIEKLASDDTHDRRTCERKA